MKRILALLLPLAIAASFALAFLFIGLNVARGAPLLSAAPLVLIGHVDSQVASPAKPETVSPARVLALETLSFRTILALNSLSVVVTAFALMEPLRPVPILAMNANERAMINRYFNDGVPIAVKRWRSSWVRPLMIC